jgi:hypothetical protein
MEERMTRPWDAFSWWEIRRIPFNIAVLFAGALTLFVVETIGARFVPPGQAVIDPEILLFAVPAYVIAANICYSLGWISEILWSGGDTAHTEPYRIRIFWLGTAFSVLITLVPSVLLPLLWAIFTK